MLPLLLIGIVPPKSDEKIIEEDEYHGIESR